MEEVESDKQATLLRLVMNNCDKTLMVQTYVDVSKSNTQFDNVKAKKYNCKESFIAQALECAP